MRAPNATSRPSSPRRPPLVAAALALALLAPPARPADPRASTVLQDLEHQGLVSHLSQWDRRWLSYAIGRTPHCDEGVRPQAGSALDIPLYRCADHPDGAWPGYQAEHDTVIGTSGCVLTSLSMIAPLYRLLPGYLVPVPDWDVLQRPSPEFIHVMLAKDGAYLAGDEFGMTFFNQPLRRAFHDASLTTWLGLRVVLRAWPAAKAELDAGLALERPFVLSVRVDPENPDAAAADLTHAFVVVGRTTDDYLVLDPWERSDANFPGHRARTLGEALGVSPEQAAGRIAEALQVTPVDAGGTSWFAVEARSPVELLLVAPDGRRTGLDPAGGPGVEEIPGSAYARQPRWIGTTAADRPKTLSVADPAAGTWSLSLLATGDGPFTLLVAGESGDGAPLAWELTGTVRAGEVRRFVLHHAPGAAQPFAVAEGTTIPPLAEAGPGRAVFTGVPVPFDASRSRDLDGTIASHAWDFGDGTTGSGATPSHAYAAPGAYVASVTVTDDQGATGRDTVTVSVVSPASSASSAATEVVDLLPGASFALGGDWPNVAGDLPAMSGDGSVVAFSVTPSRGATAVHVRDRAAGTTTRLGVGTAPTVSRSGRWVAYARDGGAWVFDRQTGVESRGDLGPGGAIPDGATCAPILSGDGRHLLFVSNATNLVASRPPVTGHLYLRDLEAGTVEHVNARSLLDANCMGEQRGYLALSDDGGVVAYQPPHDAAWNFQPAVWTRATGATATGPLVSVFGGLALSGDGRFLALAGQTGPRYGLDDDVVVVDLATGAQESACVSSAGVAAEGACDVPVLSRDGRFVAFASGAANLVPGDLHATNQVMDVLVRDRTLGTTELAALSSTGEQLPAGAGTNSSRLVGGVCDDGRCAVFATPAPLVAGDGNGEMDVYLRVLGSAPSPAPPLADASGPYHGWAGRPVAFDAGRSSAPDGAPLTATWDFGDGSPPVSAPAGEATTHAYATAGRYTVAVTVSDGVRTSAAATAAVEVQAAPPAAGPGALSLHPACGAPGAAVTLLLERRPLDPAGSWNEATMGPPGSLLDGAAPAALELSLSGPGGDLTASAAVTSLVRTAPLEYSAVARWGVPAGLEAGAWVVATGGATAAFQVPCPAPAWLGRRPVSSPGGPYQAAAGAPVRFDGTASSGPGDPPLAYAWDFGDGTTGEGARPEHAYGEPGVYEVTLSVTSGDLRSDCGIMGRCSTTVRVLAAEAPPAEATGSGCGCGVASAGAEWLALLAAALAWPRRRRPAGAPGRAGRRRSRAGRAGRAPG